MPDDTNPAPSPFAAPATTAAAPAPSAAPIEGDTSFLDNTSSREPLVKPCVTQGVVAAIPAKTSATGNPYLSVTVSLFGDKLVFEDGTPVSPGKRLTSSFFASAKDEEKLRMTGRKLKNLLLALHNIPLDGKEDAAYQALPTAEKILRVGPLTLSLSAFEPESKWVGTKVMVQVKTGKDMDGEPRNEFALLAASTKPVERKPRA